MNKQTCRQRGGHADTAAQAQRRLYRRHCVLRRTRRYECASSGHHRTHTPSQSTHYPATHTVHMYWQTTANGWHFY